MLYFSAMASATALVPRNSVFQLWELCETHRNIKQQLPLCYYCTYNLPHRITIKSTTINRTHGDDLLLDKENLLFFMLTCHWLPYPWHPSASYMKNCLEHWTPALISPSLFWRVWCAISFPTGETARMKTSVILQIIKLLYKHILYLEYMAIQLG